MQPVSLADAAHAPTIQTTHIGANEKFLLMTKTWHPSELSLRAPQLTRSDMVYDHTQYHLHQASGGLNVPSSRQTHICIRIVLRSALDESTCGSPSLRQSTCT
jgi:hypothetical protein